MHYRQHFRNHGICNIKALGNTNLEVFEARWTVTQSSDLPKRGYVFAAKHRKIVGFTASKIEHWHHKRILHFGLNTTLMIYLYFAIEIMYH